MLTTLDSTLAPMPFPITRPTPPQPRAAEPPEPPEPPAPDADDNDDSDDDRPKRPEGWCRHFTDMPAGLSNEEFTARVGHGEFQLPSSRRRRAFKQLAKVDSAIGHMVESWEPRPGLVLEFPKDWQASSMDERTRLPTAKDAFSIRATFFGDGLCGFFVDSREPDLYAAYGRELRAVAAKLLEAAATVEALAPPTSR